MKDVIISVGVAAQILGIHPDTVRDNPDGYGLKPVLTPKGHRRYKLKDILVIAKDREASKTTN